MNSSYITFPLPYRCSNDFIDTEMHGSDLFRLRVGGAEGVGKTTLIDRLCIELRDELPIWIVQNNLNGDPDPNYADNVKLEASSHAHRLSTNPLRKPHSSVRKQNLPTSRRSNLTDMKLIILDGQNNWPEAWYGSSTVDDFIYLVEANRFSQQITHGGSAINDAGLLVVNKIDSSTKVDTDFYELALNLQEVREFKPVVLSSLHTGYGLNLIIIYIKQKIILKRMLKRHRYRV